MADTHRETMHKHSKKTSLRTALPLCKDAALGSTHKRSGWALLVLAIGWSLPACRVELAAKTVRLTDLESAPPMVVMHTQRMRVTDAEGLRALCTPLGPRLGLLQVRSVADWNRLAKVAPGLGRCPDLRCGTFVGLACWAGTRVDGHWPIHIEAIRVREGAGLIEAKFQGGTFLPDGTVALETAHVPGLATILVAEINGTTFCPE
jgi:hypothetical protein